MQGSDAARNKSREEETTEILQCKIDSGDLDKMPPIPTMEWCCLQFVPNDAHHEAAEKITGLL
eukprot:11542306-Ditylum_brightwellii.AAC.1